MKVYIYPENMKGRATLWLWQMWDLVAIIIGCVLSVVLLVLTGTVVPLAVVWAYGFLTIRLDERSVMDYLKNAVQFCIFSQQIYFWRLENEFGRPVKDRE